MDPSEGHNEDRPVSELESHLGFWLRFVSNHVSASFGRLVQANGVSVMEWVVLRQLYQGRTASPGQLVGTTGMTKGAISKVIARLEDKGLVSTSSADADRRARIVALTAKGKALVPKLAALADANDERFFGHLPPQQKDELMARMKEIVRIHQLTELPVE